MIFEEELNYYLDSYDLDKYFEVLGIYQDYLSDQRIDLGNPIIGRREFDECLKSDLVLIRDDWKLYLGPILQKHDSILIGSLKIEFEIKIINPVIMLNVYDYCCFLQIKELPIHCLVGDTFTLEVSDVSNIC